MIIAGQIAIIQTEIAKDWWEDLTYYHIKYLGVKHNIDLLINPVTEATIWWLYEQEKENGNGE